VEGRDDREGLSRIALSFDDALTDERLMEITLQPAKAQACKVGRVGGSRKSNH
jgi:hypothetical protein